jgi:hypothetical protein
MDKIIFNLKTLWDVDGKIVNLYDEIKAGRKTSEWRDAKHYWFIRLLKHMSNVDIISIFPPQEEVPDEGIVIDITKFLRYKTAWFVRGYPKGNTPRLEATISGIKYWIHKNQIAQFEIQFKDVVEFKESTKVT